MEYFEILDIAFTILFQLQAVYPCTSGPGANWQVRCTEQGLGFYCNRGEKKIGKLNGVWLENWMAWTHTTITKSPLLRSQCHPLNSTDPLRPWCLSVTQLCLRLLLQRVLRTEMRRGQLRQGAQHNWAGTRGVSADMCRLQGTHWGK